MRLPELLQIRQEVRGGIAGGELRVAGDDEQLPLLRRQIRRVRAGNAIGDDVAFVIGLAQADDLAVNPHVLPADTLGLDVEGAVDVDRARRVALGQRRLAEHLQHVFEADQAALQQVAQLSTGYPASNFLPDLQEFRQAHPNSQAVVNAYEPHDEVYRSLEQKGGTILIRGRGIVASRIIQRVWEARDKNKDIRLLHLVRSQIPAGHKYDLARRALRNDVEQQPFNWPKSCWGGTLREKLEKASPEERPKLLAAWGGTTTADRDDWNQIIEQGTKEGWYKVFYGKVGSIAEKGAKVVTRLEATEGHRENVDLTADFVVDCTGLIARVDETPILADLVRIYDLPRNRAAGDGAELRLAGLAVNTAFEVTGLQNGRGHVWAAGVVTANGPYAAVDSFLGLQYAALRSADHLGLIGAPRVAKFGPLRSATQWVKWCFGSSP